MNISLAHWIEAELGKDIAMEVGRVATNLQWSINIHLLMKKEERLLILHCWFRKFKRHLTLERDSREAKSNAWGEILRRMYELFLNFLFFFFFSLIVLNSNVLYNEFHGVYD